MTRRCSRQRLTRNEARAWYARYIGIGGLPAGNDWLLMRGLNQCPRGYQQVYGAVIDGQFCALVKRSAR